MDPTDFRKAIASIATMLFVEREFSHPLLQGLKQTILNHVNNTVDRMQKDAESERTKK